MTNIEPGTLIAILALFAAPLAAFVTWWLNRGKTSLEGAVSLVNASGAAVDAIHEVMGALQTDLEKTKLELEEVRKQNVILIQSMADLRELIQTAIQEQHNAPSAKLWHLLSHIPGTEDSE
jgi:uncharacterized protein YaaN involved in tellurite resistance